MRFLAQSAAPLAGIGASHCQQVLPAEVCALLVMVFAPGGRAPVRSRIVRIQLYTEDNTIKRLEARSCYAGWVALPHPCILPVGACIILCLCGWRVPSEMARHAAAAP